ncbi:hypothetical protein ACVXG9_00335 [Escherichia coli]
MVMSYGNSEEDSQEHTGSQLRIAGVWPTCRQCRWTDRPDRSLYTMKAALGRNKTAPGGEFSLSGGFFAVSNQT